MRLWDELEGVEGRTATIARRVKVHPVTVVKWAHKNGKEVIYPFNRPARIDREEVIALRKERRGGKPKWTHRDIAEIVGCSKSNVTKILNEERQKYLDDGKELPRWLAES